MAMRMVSSKHVFSGSMKRFKRVPVTRKEYFGNQHANGKAVVEATDSETSVPDDVSVAVEEQQPKRRKSKKSKADGDSGNNDIKNEYHE